MTKKLLAVLTSAMLGVSLSGCGGGGSSDTTAPTGSNTTTPPAAARSTAAVGLVSSQTPSGGVVPSGAAKDVMATYTGSASAGELVQVSVNFAKNTYSWKVVQSSYGITNQTGSGTLTVASSGGGYTMSGGGSLFLTQAGSIQVSGLALNGVGNVTVLAQPPASSAPTLADVAGTYVFGELAHSPTVPLLNDSSRKLLWGVIKINADGTGRMCENTGTYSDSCLAGDGLPTILTVKANDSNCPSSVNNAFGVYVAPDFVGCAVLSSNGTGNVMYLDKQASANGNIEAGYITMVQLPVAGSTMAMQNGTYTSSDYLDLSGDADDCASQRSVSNGVLSMTCSGQPQTFPLVSKSPLPAGVIGWWAGGLPSDMLLPLSADVWINVHPTHNLDNSSQTERGSTGVFKRTGN